MKVGDLVKFKVTKYIGVIVEFTSYDGVRVLVTGDEIHFKNPTIIGIKTLHDKAQVINESR